jgi:hypothetical protein
MDVLGVVQRAAADPDYEATLKRAALDAARAGGDGDTLEGLLFHFADSPAALARMTAASGIQARDRTTLTTTTTITTLACTTTTTTTTTSHVCPDAPVSTD